jgi:hypothetical protein
MVTYEECKRKGGTYRDGKCTIKSSNSKTPWGLIFIALLIGVIFYALITSQGVIQSQSDESKFVGDWQAATIDGPFIRRFYSDGTALLDGATSSWKIVDNILVVTYHDYYVDISYTYSYQFSANGNVLDLYSTTIVDHWHLIRLN